MSATISAAPPNVGVPRNLVVFSDGTGNSAAKLFKTNVWRVYEALDLNCADQVAYYDDGVGTASVAPLALLGGAFGWGLRRNVLDLYVFLCRNYKKGDRIFAFGFSRGAFTIRVLTGLVTSEGLIQDADGAELKRMASWAYRRYRERYGRKYLIVRSLRWLRNSLFATWDRILGRPPYQEAKKHPGKIEIEFLGLWDTVDAYGLPFDELTRGWDRWIWPLSLPDQKLPANVKKACHALALDDERQTFHPLLCDERGEPGNATSTDLHHERISQVWFAGVHSNLGGGYPDDALAYTSLCWIAGEAISKGLRFMPHLCAADQTPNAWKGRATPCATMHDSRRGPGAYYRYAPRRIQGLQKDIDGNVLVVRPKIHCSVFERIATSLDGYAPIVLPEEYAVVGRSGKILAGDRNTIPQPVAPNPYEDSTQATVRSLHQESAWNLVWWRRVVYFTTVAFTLLMLLVPLWPGRDRIGYFDYALPIMSATVNMMGSLLPGFMAGWLTHYETYPLQLLLGIAIIAALMVTGTNLQQTTSDRMRKVWKASGVSARPVTVPPMPVSRFIQFRTSPAYFGFFRFFSRSVWPHLFGIAMLFLIVGGIPVGLLRMSFDTASVLGWVCRGNALPTKSQDGLWTFAFEPRTFCHSTGIPIERGVRYRVEVLLPGPQNQWMDGDIGVPSPAGFTSGEKPWLFYALAPLKRVLQADWFVPIARVAATGAEHYALNEAVTEFTAQRNGELIVFVNDVIAPWPNWDRFYRNNSGGAACLRISRLEPNEASERVPLTPPVCSVEGIAKQAAVR